jgi:ankyrin repeat protein
VLDATDPLVYGSLDATSWTLAEAAHQFFLILQEHVAGKDVEDQLVACIDEFPETCQVKYPYRGHALYPLTIFSATGCVRGAKAAYQAFPESIGMEASHNGLPLHVAAANDRAKVAVFLKNAYPDALAVGNQRDGQTPLHLACRYGSKDTIQVMITPTALQSMDKKGLYPVHRLCENPTADPESFDTLVNASALVATSVTMDLRNPLHIAAKSGNVALLKRVIAAAPENARATDECLQVPLHVAAAANQRQSVECLTRILPAAIHAIDDCGNRPRDLTSDPWTRSLCSRYHSKSKETQSHLVDSL